MLCSNKDCKHEICEYIGATVGGHQLYACPKCGAVYCPSVIDEGNQSKKVR